MILGKLLTNVSWIDISFKILLENIWRVLENLGEAMKSLESQALKSFGPILINVTLVAYLLVNFAVNSLNKRLQLYQSAAQFFGQKCIKWFQKVFSKGVAESS